MMDVSSPVLAQSTTTTAMDVDDHQADPHTTAAAAESVIRIERAGSHKDMILSPTSASHSAHPNSRMIPLPLSTQRGVSKGTKAAVESDSEDDDNNALLLPEEGEGGEGGGLDLRGTHTGTGAMDEDDEGDMMDVDEDEEGDEEEQEVSEHFVCVY